MQDDSPWKPPTDGGDPHDAPSLPTTPTPPAVTPATPTPAPPAPTPATPAPPAPDWSAGQPSVPPPTIADPPPQAGRQSASTAEAPWATTTATDGFAAPATDPFGDPTSAGDHVLVETGGPGERPRRSKWLVGGAVAAVVATGAAGVFAVANLTGGARGGASTPDELGFSLMQAIENEDVLGVIDVLVPGERDVFRDPLVDLVAELTRLEVLSTDADLSRILGLDVELSAETVTAVSTNVPDITNIDMRADAVVTFDGAQVPVGALVTDNLPDDMLTEMRGTRLTQTEEFDVRLTAVEEDGRWYFSVFHTIAELSREDLAPGSLIPVQGIGADGAESPQAAVDAVFDRVESLDLTGLLRTLNPGEAAALQRYAPLFLEEAEAELEQVPLEWEITQREFRIDESGDGATVFLDAIAVEGVAEGETFTFGFDGDCIRAEAAGESFEQCNDGALADTEEFFGELPATEQLITTITEAFADMEEIGIELRRSEGLWYVSPTATVTEAFLAALRALDRSELDQIIDEVPAAADEFVGALFGGFGRWPGEFVDDFGEDFAVEDGGTITEVDPGTAPADTTPGVDPGRATSWEDCYEELEPGSATNCFEAAVERGEIDESFIPLALRYPECGYQISWGGQFYSLPDDEFIAAAEAARPCFLDLVESGEVDEFELPTEILHLECFEGRNWYNVFDDPEYDERYYACIDAAFEG